MTKPLAIALLALTVLFLLVSPAMASPTIQSSTPVPTSTLFVTPVSSSDTTSVVTLPIVWGGWMVWVYRSFIVLVVYGLFRFVAGVAQSLGLDKLLRDLFLLLAG